MYDLEKVWVKDIAEYPDTFGGNCTLLKKNGLNVYQNTEEEIVSFLEATAQNPDNINICTSERQCRNILEGLKNHVKFQEQPIKLSKYKGICWVIEGKHRVCMAKRAKIDWVWANVCVVKNDDIGNNRIILPSIKSGEHLHVVKEIRQINQENYFLYQEELVLWMDIPDYVDAFTGLHTIKLNFLPDTNGWELIQKGVEGIYYNKTTYTEKTSLFSFLKFWSEEKKKIKIEIKILPDHTNTKIWLMSIPIKDGKKQLDKIENIYRHGLWRNHHLKKINPFEL